MVRDGIAVIIPCYNEALTIGKVIDDFRSELPEATVYVYDNNSTDGTAEIARTRGAIVKYEPRQGKGNVCRQMFRDIDADCYLMVDGDDTYPAESARSLCAPILAGEADMVVGDRLSNGTYAQQNARAFHGFGNDLVRAMIRWIYGYGFEDVMTGYRAMSRPFVKTFPVLSEGFQIETELSIHAVDRRWRIADVPVEYRNRPEGSVSKLNTVRDGLKVIAMIGTLFKDYRPLKFFSLVALLFCIGGLCAGIPVVTEYLATGLARFETAAHAGLALERPAAEIIHKIDGEVETQGIGSGHIERPGLETFGILPGGIVDVAAQEGDLGIVLPVVGHRTEQRAAVEQIAAPDDLAGVGILRVEPSYSPPGETESMVSMAL